MSSSRCCSPSPRAWHAPLRLSAGAICHHPIGATRSLDYAGKHRALVRDTAPYAMGGVDFGTAALVVDDTPVIVLAK